MTIQWRKILILFFSFAFISGVASADEEMILDDVDPWEDMNRDLYEIHKGLDIRLLRPIAVSYNAVLPPFARKSVTNFFRNINEIPNTLNSLLQFRPKEAVIGTTRFLINSTLGIGGIFDVAAELGIERESTDFGETLYVWSWKNSPFLIVPLFGPTTVRDGLGVAADYWMTPWPYLPDRIDWTAFGIIVISSRAGYLDAEAILSVAALDEYAFIRDAYLQNRYTFMEGDRTAEEYFDDNWYE